MMATMTDLQTMTVTTLHVRMMMWSQRKMGDIIKPMDAIKSVMKILRAPSIDFIALGACGEEDNIQPAAKAPSS